MKIIIQISAILLLPFWGFSQNNLTLEQCYDLAKKNYPLMKKNGLLQQATNLKLENIAVRKKPQITWNAQATLQTETVKLPEGLPLEVTLPLARVQTTLDAAYSIYDGDILKHQTDLEKSNLAILEQEIEVELEQLKPRVNQPFLAILLLREKTKVLQNALASVEAQMEQMEAGVRHGILLEGSVDKLKVKALQLENSMVETEGEIHSMIVLLGQMIRQKLSDDVELELPEMDAIIFEKTINRPEFQLFELQKNKLLASEQLLTASEKPKVAAFLQAGVGYPNPLNFFDDTVSPFAVGGVKFSWNFVDWGRVDREREILVVNSQLIDNQREILDYNLNVQSEKYEADLVKIENLTKKDEEIVALQSKILETISAQVKNGVATSTDYILQMNAEIESKLQLETHKIQLEQAKILYLTHKGVL